MKSAFLWGYYGYGNFGDELMFEACTELLKKSGFETVVVPLPQGREVNGIRPVNKFSPAIIEVLRKVDVSVAGGGELLQDATSFRSILYYYSLSKLSLLSKKKLIFLGNSLGTLKRRLSRLMVRDILGSENTYFIARDAVSYRYAKLFCKHTFLGTDPAVLSLMNKGIEARRDKKVVFFLKQPMDLSLVVKVLKEMGFEDLRFSKAFPGDCDAYPPFSREGDALSAILSSSLVITERFHPALVAAFFGIPFVVIQNLKARRFFERYSSTSDWYSKRDQLDISLRLPKVLEMKEKMGEKMREDAIKMEEIFLNVSRG